MRFDGYFVWFETQNIHVKLRLKSDALVLGIGTTHIVSVLFSYLFTYLFFEMLAAIHKISILIKIINI